MAKDPTRLALARVGREFVKQLKSDVKNKHYASGRMMRSIDYRVVDNVVEIVADEALDSVSYGTKPSKTGDRPPAGMVNSIENWMRAKGIKPLRSSKGRFKKLRPAAYAISRSILQKGIKGSDIIATSYAKVANKIEDHIIVAFKERIKEELEMTTKDLNV